METWKIIFVFIIKKKTSIIQNDDALQEESNN